MAKPNVVNTLPKFERANTTSQRNTKDEEGSICVKVYLTKAGAPVSGNITRSLTLKDTTVSEVFEAIEKAITSPTDETDDD